MVDFGGQRNSREPPMAAFGRQTLRRSAAPRPPRCCARQRAARGWCADGLCPVCAGRRGGGGRGGAGTGAAAARHALSPAAAARRQTRRRPWFFGPRYRARCSVNRSHTCGAGSSSGEGGRCLRVSAGSRALKRPTRARGAQPRGDLRGPNQNSTAHAPQRLQAAPEGALGPNWRTAAFCGVGGGQHRRRQPIEFKFQTFKSSSMIC